MAVILSIYFTAGTKVHNLNKIYIRKNSKLKLLAEFNPLFYYFMGYKSSKSIIDLRMSRTIIEDFKVIIILSSLYYISNI